MRWLFCICLLPVLLQAQGVQDTTKAQHPLSAGRDLWLAKDKADHLVASSFLVGLGYYIHNKEMKQSKSAGYNSAFVFSFSFGLAKEAYDQYHRKTGASWKDLVADLAGCLLGYAALRAGHDLHVR
jgi:putative lipoprotein